MKSPHKGFELVTRPGKSRRVADGDDKKIERDVKGGFILSLIQLLLSAQVVTPVLRVLGNIVTRTDTQTDAVIQSDALTLLAKLTTRLWTNTLCKSELEQTKP